MGSSGQIKQGEMLLLLLLADHANKNWACWPSLRLLVADSCMAERSVRRHMRSLEELGVLSCRATYDARTGLRTGNYIQLVESVMADIASAGSQSRQRVLDEEATHEQRISYSKKLPVGTIFDAESAPSANLAGGQIPANSRPAKLAGGEKLPDRIAEIPVNSRPANLAGGDDPSANLAQPASKLAKNASLPLKGSRAHNPQVNHQSINQGGGVFDDWDDNLDWSTPASQHDLELWPTTIDGLTDGSTDEAVKSENRHEPIAVPVMDDDQDTTAAAPSDDQITSAEPVKELSDEELADLYHRGVKLDQIAKRGAAQGLVRERAIWREVVNIVLDRAGTVANAGRYVASAVDRDAGVLVAEAVSRLGLVVKTAKEPEAKLHCETHNETYKATSECWMCRADRLSGGVKDDVQPLTVEQIQSLPEHARDMATPGFSHRFNATQAQPQAVHEDEYEGVPAGIAPWDID